MSWEERESAAQANLLGASALFSRPRTDDSRVLQLAGAGVQIVGRDQCPSQLLPPPKGGCVWGIVKQAVSPVIRQRAIALLTEAAREEGARVSLSPDLDDAFRQPPHPIPTVRVLTAEDGNSVFVGPYLPIYALRDTLRASLGDFATVVAEGEVPYWQFPSVNREQTCATLEALGVATHTGDSVSLSPSWPLPWMVWMAIWRERETSVSLSVCAARGPR